MLTVPESVCYWNIPRCLRTGFCSQIAVSGPVTTSLMSWHMSLSLCRGYTLWITDHYNMQHCIPILHLSWDLSMSNPLLSRPQLRLHSVSLVTGRQSNGGRTQENLHNNTAWLINFHKTVPHIHFMLYSINNWITTSPSTDMVCYQAAEIWIECFLTPPWQFEITFEEYKSQVIIYLAFVNTSDLGQSEGII